MAPLINSHVHIPAEILVHIVMQLDPITLVALSQTSQSWRALINPNRHDYNQRLLALELTPEYSGIVPLFDEPSNTPSPPFESPEWKLNKYACCGCMKLLSHMIFDNDAVLRPAYRKPPPGSVEANKAKFTDWEPSEPSVRLRRIQERVALSEAERGKWLRAVEHRRERQPSSQPSPTAWGLGYQAHCDAQSQKSMIGTGRQKRRCVECQRKKGLLVRVPSRYPCHFHPGFHCRERTSVASRDIRPASYFEREFPGLIQWLPPDQVPRHRQNLEWPLTLYVIHCPSCKKWQESPAFRLFQAIRGFLCDRPEDPHLLCNDCHLETYQDFGFLAQEFSGRALYTL